MSLTRAALVSASATAAATAGKILKHEQNTRQATERFAAAALETLLNAIDANDSDTGAHVRRVAVYSLCLCDAAELDERQRKNVERVALFHDIGKIHEALFDIVHEQQRLSPAERRAIHTHPQRGAEVLAPLNGFYPDLPDGVLSHHERWDGKGYPRGLKGRRIPMSARIVAIADTFDAVTQSRRYRPAQPVEVGGQIIMEGRGTQFDPEFVDLFLFPPVFERIALSVRKVSAWKQPVEQRRTGEDEENVPDISFRWRPGRHGARGRPASDQSRRKVR
jgi:HD-GYP domain-containing protein (c-di-GMP phosphodiesterase class II)